MTILSPKTLLHTKHISKARKARLQIQLTTLRQKRRLAIIIKLEKRRSSLYLSLNHAWWSHFYDAVALEGGAEGPEEAGSDLED